MFSGFSYRSASPLVRILLKVVGKLVIRILI